MFRELDTFLAVVQHGSFSAAGMAVGLTQSAVSAQIQRLETALGAPIFDRVGRRVHLNARGRAALPIMRQIIELFDSARTRNADTPVRGTLKMGAIASVHATLLPPALRLFQGRLPEVTVRIVPGVSWVLLDQVGADELACAVIIKPPIRVPQALHWQVLWQEPYVVVTGADETLTDWRRALTARPFIRYERTSFGGRQVEQFLKKHRIDVKDAVEVDELDAIESLIASQRGVSLMPLVDIDRVHRQGLKVLPLGPLTFYREIGVVSRAGIDDTTLAAQLLACLAEAAQLRQPSA